MTMKSITKTITVNIEYDYVIFDGTNFDEVREFVDTYKLYGDSDIEESFHKRPDDIPNLDENELFQWWESTGKEDVYKGGGRYDMKYNTHNRNNMPLWRKDEILMIEFKSEHDGYINREWLCKNVAILLVNGRHYILHSIDEKEVLEFIENLIC